MTSKIKQLIPAESWYVLYWTSKPPYYSLRRLIAFALIESEVEGETIATIDAFDQDHFQVSLCKQGDQGDFSRYVYETEIDDDFGRSNEAAGKSRAQAATEYNKKFGN